MKKQWMNFLINPFERIAGFQALGWGLLGMVVSTVICYLLSFRLALSRTVTFWPGS